MRLHRRGRQASDCLVAAGGRDGSFCRLSSDHASGTGQGEKPGRGPVVVSMGSIAYTMPVSRSPACCRSEESVIVAGVPGRAIGGREQTFRTHQETAGSER